MTAEARRTAIMWALFTASAIWVTVSPPAIPVLALAGFAAGWLRRDYSGVSS